ncbi:hypothetical protein PRZ48_003732 [Zasmidium cellare]|uniref:F-box domain-containing protein n=1 Tax=Zasmidium cellare TaxID=395010 RepID=A0ABR0EVX9_ZASCE|nr:hypothetical protein PRZ48_003732 [Zasmidium cellare]
MSDLKDATNGHYAADFWQLPELLSLVASNLSHPGDLKSLCLTSRSLHAAVTPVLYRRVEIDLDKISEDDVILKSGHCGHKHIRDLIIKSSKQSSRITDEACWQLGHLMGLLPQDRLESLCTPDGIVLSPDVLKAVFTRQRALKYMHLGPMHLSSSVPQPASQNLTGLQIPEKIGCLADLDFYGDLLRNGPNIKGLSIRAELLNYTFEKQIRLSNSVHFQDIEDDDVALGPSVVFSRLFGRLQSNAAPLPLEKLFLSRQRLSEAEESLVPFVAWENLRELQIHNCPDVDELLTRLTRDFKMKGSALRVFSLYVDDYSSPELEGRFHIVMSFLKSFEGLRFLEIRWDDPDLFFDLGCIEGHLPTLTDLCLSFQGSRSTHSWLPDDSEIQYLLQNGPNLRQLALPLKNEHNRNTGRSGIGSETVSMPVIVKAASADPQQVLILQSSHVKVLHVLSLPECRRHEGATPPDLYSFASNIMAKASRYKDSALQFLCIGDWRWYQNTATSSVGGRYGIETEGGCYFRGVQTDCFGMTRPAAIPVPAKRVKLEFPFWDAYVSDSEQYCLGAADYRLLGRRGQFT